MGTSPDVAALVGKVQRAAKAISDIEPKAVARAGDAAVDILNDSIRRVAPSARLTPRRTPVGAKRRQRVNEAIALITPYGPIGLIEGDIGPHLVGTGRRQRKVKTTSVGRFALVAAPKATTARTDYARGATTFLKGKRYGHPVRGPLYHPGVKGRHPWRNARERVDRVVIPNMANPFVTGVREVFR